MLKVLFFSLLIWLGAPHMIGSIEEKKSEEVHVSPAQIVTPDYPWGILHTGYSPDDPRQRMVAEAYDLWGLEFVSLIECENGLWNPKAIGDGGKSFGLCQLNIRRHGEPLEPERDSRAYQLSVCYSKRKAGTKFYGPQRLIWGKKCSEVAKERFYIL